MPPVDNIHVPQEEAPSFTSMSTLFRTRAHRPELMQHSMQLLDTAMRTGTVDPGLTELLAVRVSQVNYCYYSMATHTALSSHLGVSAQLLAPVYHLHTQRPPFTLPAFGAWRCD